VKNAIRHGRPQQAKDGNVNDNEPMGSIKLAA
jgi:hypothetical protein